MSMIWQGSKLQTQRTGARVNGESGPTASDSRENVPFSVILLCAFCVAVLIGAIAEAVAQSMVEAVSR